MKARRILFIFALLALLAAGQQAAASQPAWQPNIDVSVGRIAPQVENVTERKFLNPVPVIWVTRDELIEIVMEERDYLMHKNGVAEDALDRVMAEYRALQEAKQVLGKYSFTRKQVVLIRETIDLQFSRMRLKGSNWKMELFDALLAHELTHALDDQYYQIGGRAMEMGESEAGLAFRAFAEGHAVFVSSEVCRLLGYDDRSIELAQVHEPGDLNNIFTLVTYTRDTYMFFQYRHGERFIRHIHQQGGSAAVNQAFANPPVYASQIFRPALYLKAYPVPDLAALLQPVEAHLPDGISPPETSEAHEIMVRFGFLRLGAQRTEEVLAGYLTGLTHSFQTADQKGHMMVTVFAFTDSKSAGLFHTGEEELMLKQWQDIAAGENVRFKQERRLELPLGDACVWSQAAYQGPASGPIDDQQIFLQVGPLVYEVAMFNMGFGDAKITDLLKALEQAAGQTLGR